MGLDKNFTFILHTVNRLEMLPAKYRVQAGEKGICLITYHEIGSQINIWYKYLKRDYPF